MKIPGRWLALALAPFFLNDLYIIFLSAATIPLNALAYFYHEVPVTGKWIAQLAEPSEAFLPYRMGILWSLDVLVFLVIPLTFLFACFKTGKLAWANIGLTEKNGVMDWFYGLILAVQLYIMGSFVRYVLLQVFPQWEIFGWFNYDFPSGMPWRALTIVYACLTAGIIEEILFRGILLEWLKNKGFSMGGAIFLSSMLFSLIHWCQGPVQLAVTFLFGLVMAATYNWSRNLLPLIIAHILYDVIAFW